MCLRCAIVGSVNSWVAARQEGALAAGKLGSATPAGHILAALDLVRSDFAQSIEGVFPVEQVNADYLAFMNMHCGEAVRRPVNASVN